MPQDYARDGLVLYLAVLNAYVLWRIKRLKRISDDRTQLYLEATKKIIGMLSQIDTRINKLFRVKRSPPGPGDES